MFFTKGAFTLLDKSVLGFFLVCQDFMVREDGALAQRLQEEECNERFDCLVMIQLHLTLVFSITGVQVYFLTCTWRIA